MKIVLALMAATVAMAEDLAMLTELTRSNLDSFLVEGRTWLVAACFSKHWECREYSRLYLDTLMFPLSEALPDVNLARVDTYLWPEFERDLHMTRQPELYILRGRSFFAYKGDPRSLSDILAFAKGGYSQQQARQLPPPSPSDSDLLGEVAGTLWLAASLGAKQLMTGLGLGQHHWSLQLAVVAGFIYLQYLTAAFLFGPEVQPKKKETSKTEPKPSKKKS